MASESPKARARSPSATFASRRGSTRSVLATAAARETRIRARAFRMRASLPKHDIQMLDAEGRPTRVVPGVSQYDLGLLSGLHTRKQLEHPSSRSA